MTLWIDDNFRAHTESGAGRTEITTDIFDDMPPVVAKCYIYVPAGQSYTKPNGNTVVGEFVQLAVPEKELDDTQRAYEREQYQTLAAENATLTANLAALDEAYQEGVDSL